jgi:uncharacterized protein YbjT (DUF2867 family)
MEAYSAPAPHRRRRTGAAADGRMALLLGATGLVGRACLTLLLEDPAWDGVRVIGRRRTGVAHARLDEHVFDLDRLEANDALFDAADVFCCLGTTMRTAGSREAFRRVDWHYPVTAARLAAARGAGQYVLVSSVGADPGSRFFYTRVKGETERAVCEAGLESVVVARPALLVGDRPEYRPGERLSALTLRLAAPFLVGSLKRYRAIAARTVACALVELARVPQPGVRVLESDELERRGAGC